MKSLRPVVLFAFTALVLSSGRSQTPQLEVTHNDLRALKAGLLDAMNKGDIERELTFVHPNVVVTWHNAEVSRGHDGLRAYYNRLTSGPSKMVEKFSADITVDELTILHGENTGISFGSSVEHFQLTNGTKFDLNGRWSATLVREGGRWLVASLHVSTNIFDNVMLDRVKHYAIYAVIIAAVVTGLLAWFIGRRSRASSP